MANVYATKSGNWSDTTVWNTGILPTSADDVFANNFTVNVNTDFTVLSLRTTAAAPIVAGGSFVFNTAGVTGTVTSSSPLVPGATNMVQVTATTGTVAISLGGNVTPRVASLDVLINYSGSCNLNLSGTNFNGLISGGVNSTTCISKTSSGTITITGNVNGGNAAVGGSGQGAARAFSSSAGNTIVIGNVTGGGTNPDAVNSTGINQSSGTLTITGNVTGGG